MRFLNLAWTLSGSILLKTDWQYTEPVTGSYFKFKHSSFPSDGLYEIAQAQFNPDNSVELADVQQMKTSTEAAIVCLKSIPVFSNRRIALRRIPKQPSLGSEIRRVIRNDLLDDLSLEPIARRSAWSVALEVSDYVEPLNN